MKSISTIIVEDEPMVRKLIKHYVETYCPEINLIGVFKDSKSAYPIILEHEPQLLLLDIEIASEESPETAFDLLKKMPDYYYEVILITAFDHYALQAIKHNVLDYLMKPVDLKELKNAVKLALSRLNKLEKNEKLLLFLNEFPNPKRTRLKRIWISTQTELVGLDLENIVRFEADGKYTHIHMLNEKSILSSKHLKEYILELSTDSFLQVHRSHLVNLQHVSKVVHSEGGFLLMNDRSHVPVSRRKKKELLDRILKS